LLREQFNDDPHPLVPFRSFFSPVPGGGAQPHRTKNHHEHQAQNREGDDQLEKRKSGLATNG
jgi:hypothetical protein